MNASPNAAAELSPRARLKPSQINRLVAGLVLAGSLGLLIVAALLQPDPAGMGTHEQMGLPACGFKTATSLPCVSCGMTTSFAHAANGQLLTAFSVQPLGALLALITATLVWISALAMAMGQSLAPLGRALGQPRTVVVLLSLAGLAWAYTLTTHLLGM
jgi:hypothetical protein